LHQFFDRSQKCYGKVRSFCQRTGHFRRRHACQTLGARHVCVYQTVQIAADHAKGLVKRLTDLEVPAFEDTETTFAELQARVDKTIAFLQTVPADAFAHSGDKKVEISYFPGKYILGFDYVREVAMPNFFFHITTAYDIMRNAGVQLGKSDLAGHQSFHDLPAAEVASA
jgi:hypothetical protein